MPRFRGEDSKEVVVAIFFDVEKAYDFLCKESVLIKITSLGISGKIFRWVKEFCMDTIEASVSPVPALQVEMGGLPWELRRQ